MATTKKLPAHLRTFKLTARERKLLAERDILIAALGWEPEDRSSAGSRYHASTSELAVWVLEARGLSPVTEYRIAEALAVAQAPACGACGVACRVHELHAAGVHYVAACGCDA